jgi:multiple sugar transport system substrate-binding protein
MSARNSKDEGGMLPLVILLAMMLLILAYGVQKGFLSDSSADAHKPIHLSIVFPGDSAAQYQAVVDQFKKEHPEVAVEMRPSTGPKYYQQLLVMMASGNAPDLMWMGQGFGEFAQRGAFLDVGDRIKHDVDTKRFLPQALDWYRFKGNQLGIPFLLDVGFIIYNKDLFDEMGVPYPTNDWDYDQFLRIAQRMTLKDDHGRITRYGYFGGLDECLFGAQFISDDGTHSTCDTPEMIKSLWANYNLVNKYRVAPSSQQKNSLDQYYLFSSGHAAMMQAYTWDLVSLHRQCGNIRWGYVLNPKIKHQCEWASSQAVLISSKTPHPDLAWKLCRMFFAPAFQKSMAFSGLPTDLTVARELAATTEPQFDHLPTLLAAVNKLSVFPRVPHFSEAQQIYLDAQQSVMTGQDSPKEAMERASRMMNRMLQQQRRYGS